ncbi:hypothetical protein [Cellulomonas xiejunii]|uniref:Lipoprotein n=1 Tax=Cellulomonas xiejunii TaxID=2968083 RepID=A0ABY5KLU4_9CELL|nr:hypothetical protein [Cellulomonas xiejunii]MCC2320416.1 hypothetical protein [Cellulomonas xiejunii]UUI70713.1 hypothetical protein NP048_13025 [Cellulomonas xiejunii]
MSRSTVRSATTAMGAVACLALVGCVGSSAPQATTAATAAPSPTPTPSPSAPPEVACLESGTWVADLAREAAVQAETMRQIVWKYDTQFGGERSFSFADGEFTATYSGMTETTNLVTLERADVDVNITATTEGTVVAPYVATTTQVDLGDADASGIMHEVVVLENGTPWTQESDPQEERRTALQKPQTWFYECTGDTLRLVDAVDGVAPDPVEDHHVQILTRR